MYHTYQLIEEHIKLFRSLKIPKFVKLYQNQVEDCIPLNYALSVSTEEAGKSSDITEHRQT